jgi:hypothetical protein
LVVYYRDWMVLGVGNGLKFLKLTKFSFRIS